MKYLWGFVSLVIAQYGDVEVGDLSTNLPIDGILKLIIPVITTTLCHFIDKVFERRRERNKKGVFDSGLKGE